MADQAEQAFARTFLNTLGTQPVIYADDYQQPPQNSLKRVPILQVALPSPPEPKQAEASTSSSAAISLTFKSTKPAASYTISVQPTDTIASIKAQLAAQSTAPPADVQRLLLKGKALADGKLLKEYNIQAGDTVNLMIKPGYNWDPSKMPATPSENVPSTLIAEPKASRKHQRIPSVVLSPSPSDTPGIVEKDIMLTLDTSTMPTPVLQQEMSTFHQTISNPTFWDRLYAFLRSEFTTEVDAQQAFEDYLCASKGALTASEIAKIRDQVGVVGMAGT